MGSGSAAFRRLVALVAITVGLVGGPRAATAGDAPATEDAIAALIAKGSDLLERGRIHEADDAFATAADAARTRSSPALEAAALKRRFDTLGNANEWRVLRGVAARLLAVQARIGDADGAADTEHDVGAVAANLGNYREADYHMRRAEAYWADKDDVARRTSVQLSIAKLREFEGRLADAWTLAETVRDSARALKDTALEADVLGLLAGLQLTAGDPADARALAKQALDLLGDEGDMTDVALTRGLIAVADYQVGNYAEARATLLQVLDTFDEVKDANGACQALLHLAEVDEREGKFESALAHARRVRARAGDSTDLEGWALESMGDAEVGLGHHEEALKLYTEALALAERLRSAALLLDVRRGMARAYLARGDLERAIGESKQACDALESFASGLDDQHRTSLRASEAAEAYEVGIQAAVRRRDAESFAEFVERQRAGSLLHGLGGRRMLRGVGLPAALATDDQKAHEALVEADAQLRAAREARVPLEELRRAAAAHAAAQRRYEEVVARIQRDAHREAAVAYPTVASLSDLQASVWPGEALVLYAVLPDDVVALVVTSDGARRVRVGATADVEKALEAVVDAGGGVDDLSLELLAAAAKSVLAPLELPATVKRLLVSPDGILANAPLTAMLAALGPADRAVALVPSGSTYRLLLEDRGQAGKRVLAMGDPEYAPPTAPLRAAPPAVLALRGRAYAPLPASRAEVLAITREGSDVRLLRGQATEAGLKAALAALPKGERWRAVHLACHGLLDRERPGFCALALTRGPGPTDDGMLTVHEIFAMRIPADLVVLSACQTALGRPERGEGIVGFTRAFFHAGAPRVVVSLWAVDDDATRELMTAFYAALAGGASHAAALRDAQAHVRAIPKWAAPRFWAAWVLWGLPS